MAGELSGNNYMSAASAGDFDSNRDRERDVPRERPPIQTRFGKIIPNRIFIGGLTKDTTEEDLRKVFCVYGTVKSTKIVSDRLGVSKGYGFVTFETIEDAQRIQKDVESVMIKDTRIKIAQAVRKQNLVNIPGHNHYNHHTGLPDPASIPMLYQQSLQYPPFYQYGAVPPPVGMPFYWQPYF